MSNTPSFNSLLARIAVVVLLLSPALAAGAVTLEEILRNTAVAPPSRVCFVEERHNTLLREPLVITGYLEYRGDGKLSKVVQAPFKESFVLDGDTIEVTRDGETRQISLRKGRPMMTMLNGIEALLAGDIRVLQRVFETKISGRADDWTLTLLPESRRMRNRLQRITVSGNAKTIASIQFELENDERQLMRIGGRDIDNCGAHSNSAPGSNE